MYVVGSETVVAVAGCLFSMKTVQVSNSSFFCHSCNSLIVGQSIKLRVEHWYLLFSEEQVCCCFCCCFCCCCFCFCCCCCFCFYTDAKVAKGEDASATADSETAVNSTEDHVEEKKGLLHCNVHVKFPFSQVNLY